MCGVRRRIYNIINIGLNGLLVCYHRLYTGIVLFSATISYTVYRYYLFILFYLITGTQKYPVAHYTLPAYFIIL